MAASPQLINDCRVSDDYLIANIVRIYKSLCELECLKPSMHVNGLFTQLVKLCTLPSSIDIKLLSIELQQIRQDLIGICARAEGLLELEFSTLLSKIPRPLNCLHLFPYYSNYIELAGLEYKLLTDHGLLQPKRVAFVGSGPMPLTSIVLATQHMLSTYFANYDLDASANDMAQLLVSTDQDLARRMAFRSCDIRNAREELAEFDCIFLAALVGMTKDEKVKILRHIGKYMKAGGFLLVRSANGARAFLYPVVEDADLSSFRILQVFHPTNDVINSIIVAQKPLSSDQLCDGQ
ncbi:nicotianamine synthase-like [Nymphaea colorata]|uniref:Nicotianamine synthase n=1 Tax=Nymphaea colorata TaxID=210225 RepID=A0A5K1BX09_9MAGN|nr:nicotianamine synthase-like [Nymphaea colorata]